MDERDAIAWRAAQDLPKAGTVNLGRGLPSDVVNFVPRDCAVMLHSENGLLGLGRIASDEPIDRSISNANKVPVTLVPGASIVDLAESFDMIRGGHIDLVLLGGFQVSQAGDLANWATDTDGELPPAVGGAMDLAASCRSVWVLMTHVGRGGEKKLLDRCTYPLTAAGVVTRIYTELGTFRPSPAGFEVLERSPHITPSELEALTGARIIQSAATPALRLPG